MEAIVVNTVPPAPPLAPIIVICGLVEACDSVMFDPATNTKAEEAAVFAVPEVEPPAVTAPMDTSVVAELEMVMLLAAVPKLMPAPAISVTLLEVPFRLKFVAAGTVAEMVRLCAPPPTLTIPAPETFSRFENVPAELDVVLPSIVIETEAV
jgi:hypothetical protein